jgi:hypothetical protein
MVARNMARRRRRRRGRAKGEKRVENNKGEGMCAGIEYIQLN